MNNESYNIFQPMGADHTLDGCTEDAIDKITYPKIVMPKYDGIRVITSATARGGTKLLSRNGLDIPNFWLGKQSVNLPTGLEGEIVCFKDGVPDFKYTTSCVKSIGKYKDFEYKIYLFDLYGDNRKFTDRLSAINKLPSYPNMQLADWYMVHGKSQLLEMEDKFVSLGYEGIVIKDPNGKYKHGRCTFKSQTYMSMKRKSTEQAVIVGYKCLTKKTGESMDTLGSLFVVSDTGVEFSVGSGLDDSIRSDLWDVQDTLIGKKIEFSYQKTDRMLRGEEKTVRFPVFLRMV